MFLAVLIEFSWITFRQTIFQKIFKPTVRIMHTKFEKRTFIVLLPDVILKPFSTWSASRNNLKWLNFEGKVLSYDLFLAKDHSSREIHVPFTFVWKVSNTLYIFSFAVSSQYWFSSFVYFKIAYAPTGALQK